MIVYETLLRGPEKGERRPWHWKVHQGGRKVAEGRALTAAQAMGRAALAVSQLERSPRPEVRVA